MRQHDNGNGAVLPYFPEQVETIHNRHHSFENSKINVLLHLNVVRSLPFAPQEKCVGVSAFLKVILIRFRNRLHVRDQDFHTVFALSR
jgi:hypothetical protein